jgi:hypothetical protein
MNRARNRVLLSKIPCGNLFVMKGLPVSSDWLRRTLLSSANNRSTKLIRRWVDIPDFTLYDILSESFVCATRE